MMLSVEKNERGWIQRKDYLGSSCTSSNEKAVRDTAQKRC
jgi:hypothetical protein